MMMIQQIICILLISTFSLTVHAGSAPLGPTSSDMDAVQYEAYKNKVCKAVPAFSGGGADKGSGGAIATSKWSDFITMEEILELAFVNMAYGLSSDSVSHLKKELGWKKGVIDKISLITKATCSDDVISESFLNAAKNLFLYYMVKLQNSMGTGSGGEGGAGAEGGATNGTDLEQWDRILKSLQICASNIAPIEVVADCGVAHSYYHRDGSLVGIVPPVEALDQELGRGGDLLGLDVIIDTVWWMFSTAYARCYAYFYPNEDEILVFFQLFRNQFLAPFLTRWRLAGPMTAHFPIVFGPYDSDTAADNVRKCATASFMYEELGARQLVRPLLVQIKNRLERNFKILSI